MQLTNYEKQIKAMHTAETNLGICRRGRKSLCGGGVGGAGSTVISDEML